MKGMSYILFCLLFSTFLVKGQVTEQKKFNLDFNTYDTITQLKKSTFSPKITGCYMFLLY